MIGDVTIDRAARRVHVGDEEIALRPKEFDVLDRLARDAGMVVTREQLIDDVWDENWWGSTKTLDVHINSIRRKLGEQPGDASRIATIRGVGYRLDGRQPDSGQRGMRKRILATILAVATLAVLAFFVPAAASVRNHIQRGELLELQREASIVARRVPAVGAIDLAELSRDSVHDLALYDHTGLLVDGNGPPVADPIVAEALSGVVNEGFVEGDLVAALPIRIGDDGPEFVVRVTESAAESDHRVQRDLGCSPSPPSPSSPRRRSSAPSSPGA